ncbi:glycine receptor subunit alpha-2-like [Centruroides sculpturatus]|uniref:glycine receptor subunit alpha-2-like n=1 Tax=Centruroides sculpturatus TaxID=218467 RepID=UPI000C6D2477|nr:glycine receptor subunit alpha-2-like [Centruroides sculpturatus]
MQHNYFESIRKEVFKCTFSSFFIVFAHTYGFYNDTNLNSSIIEEIIEIPVQNISEMKFTHRLAFLDQVLEGYDKRAWPTYGQGKFVIFKINIVVNSYQAITLNNLEYSMDIYLRQAWQDQRLNLAQFGINSTVTLNGEDLVDKIWKPDLFFRNVKKASFHKVTVPNRLIKMDPDGRVLYSMRLTLRLACHMSFRHYPLDTQNCHLVVGPYAQTVDQVEIQWDRKTPIVIESPIELPEFNLISYKYDNFTRHIDTGAFSFLNATFRLERQNGYHLIQTYLPTFLIVMISWVSFWLNVDATPARVTLGVTTLLTLTTVASGVRTQLPPVSYVKAIDVWIGTCSVMVFGALLEFTLVNYLSRSKHCPEDFRRSLNIFARTKKIPINNDLAEKANASNELARNVKRAMMVDRVCRILFPLLFFIFNAIYWPYYLYVPDD